MQKLPALIVAGLLALTTGCHTTDYNATVFHPWGWENAKDAKAHLDGHKNVLLVCVYDSHWEDLGPNRLTPYHLKATVIKSYKGDWRMSERIAFVYYVDAPAPTNTLNTLGGELMFVFTNEHTNAEIALEADEYGAYNEVYSPALDYVFQK